jgi:molybdate transport system ATP-binding protein
VAALTLDLSLGLRDLALEASLEVAAGETLALVGPSGAGKTTILRCVAGLSAPDRGRVMLGEEVWCDTGTGVNLAPERRRAGLVFQDYALFPHLDVRRNVAFGGTARVDELLQRLRISHLSRARPGQISGGERQRVALARALARDPAVLLLDEPLAALDTDTRAHVRDELQDVLSELGLPVLLVTHDARDAFALADRIGVLVGGRLRQVGTASELLDSPADAFVVRFCGGNLLTGVTTGQGTFGLSDSGGEIAITVDAPGPVGLAVAPWQVAAGPPGSSPVGANVIRGAVREITREGDRVRVRVGAVVALCDPAQAAGLTRGAPAEAWFRTADVRVVPVPAIGSSVDE